MKKILVVADHDAVLCLSYAALPGWSNITNCHLIAAVPATSCQNYHAPATLTLTTWKVHVRAAEGALMLL